MPRICPAMRARGITPPQAIRPNDDPFVANRVDKGTKEGNGNVEMSKREPVSPDMARRALIIELHQSYEHPGDHIFERALDAVVLHRRRPELLGAHWALVRHWEQKKFPEASRVNSAFPEWCDIVSGIIEAAGFTCPLNPSESGIAVDEDGEDMRESISTMPVGLEFTFAQLASRCHNLDIFPLLTVDANGPTPAQGSTLGKLLTRYDGQR